MATDFSALKKSRANSVADLGDQLKKMTTNSYQNDNDEYWQPEVDKSGNGFAVIRFLPAPVGEDLPFVRLWSHSFQGPKGVWYIENCLTTLGQQDPCAEYGSELWNTGRDEDKEEVRKKYKRRLSYISNIYIVNDPAKPENNGKVFKFKYGKKIWDKINDLMNPQFPGEVAINPFDLWEGANFTLKIRKVEGYRNYDKSEFEKTAPLHEDDSVLEGIWKQEYSLSKIVDPENFRSYDELKKRLYKALDIAPPSASFEAPKAEAPKKEMSFSPNFSSAKASEPASASSTFEDEDDESLAFFSKLADD